MALIVFFPSSIIYPKALVSFIPIFVHSLYNFSYFFLITKVTMERKTVESMNVMYLSKTFSMYEKKFK